MNKNSTGNLCILHYDFKNIEKCFYYIQKLMCTYISLPCFMSLATMILKKLDILAWRINYIIY